MADNERIAAEVLDAVGGKDNITSIAHCMTRLRINLKDESVSDDDRIKAIKGVLGCQWSGGQYQVIIGQNVPKVYDAIVKLGVSAGGAIDENLDADGSEEPWSAKRVGQAILNYLFQDHGRCHPRHDGRRHVPHDRCHRRPRHAQPLGSGFRNLQPFL